MLQRALELRPTDAQLQQELQEVLQDLVDPSRRVLGEDPPAG